MIYKNNNKNWLTSCLSLGFLKSISWDKGLCASICLAGEKIPLGEVAK